MNGIDPPTAMRDIPLRLDWCDDGAEPNLMVHDLEYLFDVLASETQRWLRT